MITYLYLGWTTLYMYVHTRFLREADFIVYMEDGRVQSYGSPAEVLPLIEHQHLVLDGGDVREEASDQAAEITPIEREGTVSSNSVQYRNSSGMSLCAMHSCTKNFFKKIVHTYTLNISNNYDEQYNYDEQ